MQEKKYLFGNWKMYLNYEKSLALANALADASKNISANIKMAVFPSALAFQSVAEVLQNTGISLGAQNAHWIEEGGYTGEVSAAMYKAAGAAYILAGHSERRHLFHETNHEIRQKVDGILSVGLTPVICVGETEAEKKDNKTEEVIETQIRSAFHNIVWPEARELIVAYEPVWAVGTGVACDPIEAERVHEIIKKQVVALTGIAPVILYGGSVKPENISSYLSNPNIDGVLVGGASTNAESWLAMASVLE
jgi:triosephosphate isomerase